MKKCNAKCEVYSRVCGYFRPVSAWNEGKREEFKERKPFQIKMGMVCALFALLLLSGCASEKIAAGLTSKNVSGSGFVTRSQIGLNPDTKIPEVSALVVSGDFATVKSGTAQVSVRRETSASVWNASAVTTKTWISVTLPDSTDPAPVLTAAAELLENLPPPVVK